jgi:hypothetical protein
VTCISGLVVLVVILAVTPVIVIGVGIVVALIIGTRTPTARMIARVDRDGYASPIGTGLLAGLAMLVALLVVAIVALRPDTIAVCLPGLSVLGGIIGIGTGVGIIVGAIIGHDERMHEAARLATMLRRTDDERAVDYLAALIAEADAEIEETAGAELADEVEAWLRDGAR